MGFLKNDGNDLILFFTQTLSPMKDPLFRISTMILFTILLSWSCGSDEPEPPVKSAAKNISSFNFSGLNPEVVGTISESDKKVTLNVPFEADVTALIPSIQISEKATISPASGTAQNFTNPVTYTVTAEDGSTQAYMVTVTISDPLPSNDKDITSFKFSDFSPEVIGTITVDEVTLLVPNGTDVTSLVPSIEISEGAQISPQSGTAQDFSIPVTYTVTAEDESTKAYTVTVTIDPTVDFTIDPFDGATVITQDETLTIHGDNFGDYHNDAVTFIVSTDENTKFTLDLEPSSTDEMLVIKVPANFPPGDYKLQVKIGIQSIIMEETFTIEFHAPVVTSVEGTPVIRGENITIYGSFIGFDVVVYLNSEASGPSLEIVSQDDASLVVTIPSDTEPADNYMITVESHGKSDTYGPIAVTVQPNVPYISEITDSSIARGETMIIHGLYLKKSGVPTNINFIPWPNGGTTIIRSATANTDGTEVTLTIPDDFPTGTYEIVVEVDFEFSDEYSEIIQIN
jgi:hypothetical protein